MVEELIDFMTIEAWRLKKIDSGRGKPLLVAIACLFLASCIGPSLEDWPDSIPQTQVFKIAYNADEENQGRQSEIYGCRSV